ncbi:LCP family protein [Spiractinospora alimapuensis]|uniref:LCP family protein n=1 Tax=Spiractinospora alimapuensis TaxID=2820884 RepID=UPI001F361D23|nr:LCP family protein [Spiractinospora alimapuensis]QVQ53003.1 LCP family protein [Spiractinospora alimapuensis]
MPESSPPVSRPGTARALLWTALSVILPGSAHLRAGKRRAGTALIVGYVVLLVAAGVAAYLMGDATRAARLALRPNVLLALGGSAVVLALLWCTVVVHSYVLLRPERSGVLARLTSVVVVAALCLTVAAPAAATLRGTYIAHDRLTSIFGADAPDHPSSSEDPTAVWGDRDRVSMLLIGSDGGDNRYGVRTDSMMVANIDVEHGDVVLIGLPRNLQNVPFPEDSELAELYPEPTGFDQLLQDVYQVVEEDPELAVTPGVPNPAADTLKDTIGYAIGLDVDYYAMVDMQGFEDLIDAIGGVRIRIEDEIPWGHRGDVLEPGVQQLTGQQSLWYVRSRIGSDDYTRMGRQGCLIQAVAEQVDPWTVVTSFQDLADAAEATLETDVPLALVSNFVDLAELVPQGSMRTLQLSPPQVSTAYPDWEEVREMVAEAVQEQEDAQAAAEEDATSTPDATETGAADDDAPDEDADTSEEGAEDEESTEWQDWSGSPSASPTTPGRQVGDEPASLDEICP